MKNKETFLKVIYNNAKEIVESGQDHQPMLICYDSEQQGYVAMMSFSNDEEKRIVLDNARLFIKEKNIKFLFVVFEGWAKTFKKEEDTEAYKKGLKRVRDAEGRKEILNIMYQDQYAHDAWMCDIENKEGKRILGKLEKCDMGFTTLWSFFPDLEPSNTVN